MTICVHTNDASHPREGKNHNQSRGQRHERAYTAFTKLNPCPDTYRIEKGNPAKIEVTRAETTSGTTKQIAAISDILHTFIG